MFKHALRILDTLSTVTVILVGGLIAWRMFAQPASSAGRPQVEPIEGLSLPASSLTNARGNGSVVVVEFADYECPFCARHAQGTAKQIKSDYVDTGIITEAFAHFPLANHQFAQKASEAAECAGRQSQFWAMHDELFTDPKRLDDSAILERARTVGLDETAFRACLDEGTSTAKVRADFSEGRRLGVTGTPAFFVGIKQPDGSVELVTRVNGAVPYDAFKQAIDDAVAKRAAVR